MLTDIRVRVVPRIFHFKQPAGTSRGVYLERRVWYVVVTSTDRSRPLTGLGECAPLPDLSCDYGSCYEEILRRACAEFERTGLVDREALRPYPSILFGLETAELSAHASLRGDFLTLYDTPFTRGEQAIIINGLVWMGSREEMLRRMEEKLEQGFRCVKLKIGAIDFDEELSLIRTLRERFAPETVTLRVDANGAFSPDEAPRRLEQLSRFGIHSIEQPIRAGQWEAMADLCRRSPLPVALDEELIGINRPELKRQMLDIVRPQYIILKPSLHGGLHGAGEWMREAGRFDIRYWVTSALESNVGLNAIAQWTSALMEGLPATPGDPAGRNAVRLESDFPQGLGTGQLFTDNFGRTTLCIEGDRLWLGDREQRAFGRRMRAFADEWHSERPTMTVHTSGSTGRPKPFEAGKAQMAASAARTCRFLGLKASDTGLLCMPLDYIAGKMMVVRSLVGGFRLYAVAPSAHPLARLNFAPDFVAMTPMQVHATLQVPRERHLLRRVRHLIVGGGEVPAPLRAVLRTFPNNVWSTYGMTETLSHIAMCRLSGTGASDSYTPLPGVTVTLTADGRLKVFVPDVCDKALVTNDYAELLPDGTFRILGRADNVVCSGGLKLHIEALEAKLAPLDIVCRMTWVPDDRLGQALVLLCEGDVRPDALPERLRTLLSRYEMPRHIFCLSALPQTETGKPARAELRQLAARLLAET